MRQLSTREMIYERQRSGSQLSAISRHAFEDGNLLKALWYQLEAEHEYAAARHYAGIDGDWLELRDPRSFRKR